MSIDPRDTAIILSSAGDVAGELTGILLVATGLAILLFRRFGGSGVRFPLFASIGCLAALTAFVVVLPTTLEQVKRNELSVLETFGPIYVHEIEKLDHEHIGNSPETIGAKSRTTYEQIIELQKFWLRANPNVRDIYTYRVDADGSVRFIVDSETDYDGDGDYDSPGEERTPVGEVYDVSTDAMKRALKERRLVSDDTFSNDRWGTSISVFFPLRNRAGVVCAGLGLDFHVEGVIASFRDELRRLESYALVAFFVLLLFAAAFEVHKFKLHEHARELAEQLRLQKSIAHQAKLASLGEMASGIAHEINNPLAVLSSLATLIEQRIQARDPLLAQDLAPRLSKLDSTVQRIARITRAMRSLSRDGTRDPIAPIKVGVLVEDLRALIENRLQRDEVTVNWPTAEQANLELQCRPTQVGQVLLNLFSNAIDAIRGQNPAWIKFEVERVGDRVRFTVANSGPPIAPELRARIFEPFFTTKAPGEGTGLGLSIARTMAIGHGGSLDCSPSAESTRFVLELPIDAVHSSEHPLTASAA